jgi:PAS domain S-box-containing protein
MSGPKYTPFLALPLRYAVPGALLLFTAAIAFGTYLHNVRLAVRQVETDAVVSLSREAGALQRTLEYLFSKGDVEKVQQELAEKHADPEMEAALVADEHDVVIAAASRHVIGRPVQKRLDELRVQMHGVELAGTLEEVRARRVGQDMLSSDGNLGLSVQPVVLGAAPGQLRAERVGILLVTRALDARKAQVRREVARHVAGLALPMAAFAILLFTISHFAITRRATAFVRAARQFASGDVQARAGLRGGDELAEVGAAFDEMAGRVATAQQVLAESEARLQAISEGTSDAVFVKDVQGRYRMANAATLRFLGKTKAEVIGQDDTAVFPSEEARQIMAGDRRVMESGLTQTYEEFVTIHGQPRTFLSTKGPWHDPQGRVAGLFGIARDITERKQMEVALNQSRQDFETAQAFGHVGSWVAELEVDGKITWSAETCRIFGFAPGEFDGKAQTFFDMVHPEDRETIRRLSREAMEGHSYQFEYRIRRRDGEMRWICQHTGVERDGEGRPLRKAGVVQDVTERKQAERERRASEGRWRLAMEVARMAAWEWDLRTNIVRTGQELSRMFGGPTAGANLTTKPDYTRFIHPDDQAGVESRIQAALAAGNSFHHEFRVVWQDGSVHWIEGRAEVFRDPSGQPERMVGISADITARRQADEARQMLQARLRQSQKMEAIGTLAGGIAHDFNNILGTILGNVTLARQDVGPGHLAEESLDQIDKAGQRAKGLVQQILAFSRQEVQGKRVLQLRAAIEEDLRLLRASLPARVELVTSFAEDCPAILADCTEIHQVLLNLCTNAWHAMDGQPGCITIRLDGVLVDTDLAKVNTDLQPGQYARLTVSDTGKGMDAPTLERIFDPFFTTKQVGAGTGLGLSVVHGIMKNHQGAITVASQPGRGATFELYFPAWKGERSAQPEPISPASLPRGIGQRILYLDDEASLVSLATRLLERLGYHVSGFTDAEDALAALSAHPLEFDLVVTDFSMPGVSGLEVAEHVATLRSDLPVMLASGYLTDDLKTKARAAGIRHLLYKPNTVEDLVDAVHRLANNAPHP